MQLLTLIQTKINELGFEDSAKFFKVSRNKLEKAASGASEFPLSCGQAIIDEMLKHQRILFVAEGKGTAVQRPENIFIVDGKEYDGAKLLGDYMTMEAKALDTPQPVKISAEELHPTVPPAPSSEEIEALGSVNGKGLTDLATMVIKRRSDFAPDDRHAIIDQLSAEEKARVAVCIPTYNGMDIAPTVNLALLANTKGLKVATVSIERCYSMEDAKNLLLDRVLASSAQWAVIFEPDLIPPFGNPVWMREHTGARWADEFLGVRTVDRLTRHDDKGVVGGIYRSAGSKSDLAVQPILDPRDQDDHALKTVLEEKGPANKLVEVSWLASGCIAIHRRVLEKITEVNPLDHKGPYPFFVPVAGDRWGADKRFGKLVEKTTKRMYLDCAVRCGRANRAVVV